MFSKQKQTTQESPSVKKTKSASLTSTKRKRDSAQVRPSSNFNQDLDDEIEILDTPLPSAKKVCLESSLTFSLTLCVKQTKL